MMVVNALRNAHTDQFGTDKIASRNALKVKFTETSSATALLTVPLPPETSLAASSVKVGTLKRAFALAMAIFSAKNHAQKIDPIFSSTSLAIDNAAKRE